MSYKILPCKCHRVGSDGSLWTRLVQFSEKGKRGIQTKIGSKWTILTPVITKKGKGYKQTCIHGRILRVNRLIASNFIENPLSYPEVHHKNDIKTDNRVENLEWGNAGSNAEDRDRNGKTVRGTKFPHAKLNEEKVAEIRKLRSEMTLQALAEKYKVSKKLILLVVQDKIWKK